MNAPAALLRWACGRRVSDVAVWHHEAYRLPAVGPGLPMSPRRADDILTAAVALRWVAPDQVRSAPEISLEDAARAHDPAYLDTLDRADIVAAILAAEPHRISVAAWMSAWRRSCGGTLAAARHVVAHGGRAANLLGGFHHAGPTFGGGYCGLNDVAIAVRVLRDDGFTAPVVVLDLDAHPPDGIVACLGADPLLTVLSVSVEGAWELPQASAASVMDRRVPVRSGDDVYLRAVDEVLRRLRDLPLHTLVFYLAGADPHEQDRLGDLAVGERGLRERDRRVVRAVGSRPLVALPAGGYQPQAWRVFAGTIGSLAGATRGVPARFDPMWRRTRNPARAAPDDEPLLTQAELVDVLGHAPRAEPRFLGVYTRHGLESALSAFGYLPLLRRMGFVDLEVAIEARTAGADRVAISARFGAERAVIVDLAASIRAVDTFRCLFLEWLELADPRGAFAAGRPALPGQRRPGLGLAAETLQLTVRAAQRLSLDGVAFVAAHYHVAWIARQHLVPLDPEARGRFRALCKVLANVPLVTASRMLETTGLSTEDAAVVRWEPMLVVAPIAPTMTDHLQGGERRAAEVEASWLERLLPVQTPPGSERSDPRADRTDTPKLR